MQFFLEVVGTPYHYLAEMYSFNLLHSLVVGSIKLKILLALALLVLHAIAYHHWKEEIRAFKQKKVYQNRTIIKEVMSNNMCLREREQDTSASASRIISGWCWIMLGARWCWIVLGAGWCRTGAG